jgi:hypothetical protein
MTDLKTNGVKPPKQRRGCVVSKGEARGADRRRDNLCQIHNHQQGVHATKSGVLPL